MPADFKILRLSDKNYPILLTEIPVPPGTIYYKGVLPDSDQPHIAIVGTRKATATGLAIAKKLARELAEAGAAIVSGLALGIDAAAHEGALAGKGKTIAVLPVGINRIYPAQNENLAKQILEMGGGIISEYEPGKPSLKNHFLERNRIVSGLSVGVVVVEAPEKSGALSTAAHALEQNREVFVVPGPVNHDNYKGAHALLRAGARLVTNAAEILDDLNLAPAHTQQTLLYMKEAGLNDDQRAVLAVLRSSGEPVDVDKIRDLTKIDISVVNRNLTLLLIQGIVKEESGRYFLAR